MTLKRSRGHLKHVLRYAFGAFGARALGILALPVIAAHLSPTQLGDVVLTETVAAVATAVGALGLPTILVRLWHDDQAQDSLFATLAKGSAISLILSVATFGAFGLLLVHFMPIHPLEIACALGTGGIVQWIQIPLARYRVSEESGKYVVLSLGMASSMTAAAVLGSLLYANAAGVLAGKLVAVSCVVLLTVLLLRKPLAIRGNADQWKTALRLGFPLVPHQLIAFSLAAGDRFIIEAFCSREELGVYSLAYSGGMAMAAITSALMLAWGPEYHRRAAQLDQRGIAGGTQRVVSLLAIAAIAGSCLAPPVVNLLFSDAYSNAKLLVAPIIAGYFLHGVFSAFHLAAVQAKRTGSIPRVTIIAAVVNLGLAFTLTPFFGVQGAAFATTIGYATEAALMYVVAQRLYPLPLSMSRLLLPVALVSIQTVLESSGLVHFAARGTFALIAIGILGFPLLKEWKKNNVE